MGYIIAKGEKILYYKDNNNIEYYMIGRLQEMLAKLRKSPYALVVWIGIVSILHSVLFKSKVNYDYQLIQRVLIAVVAVVITLPLHELVHYIFFKIFGKKKVKIEFGIDPSGLPSFRTVYQGEITGGQKVLSYLAPFVFMTLLLDISFAFCTKVELFFFVVAVCNSAGCYFDIIDVLMVLRNKKSN